MALTPSRFFRSGGGDLTENHFQPGEDPEEVVQGYITEAMGKVAGVDAGLRDSIASHWVYFRAYKGAYAWVVMEPTQFSVGEAGSAGFLDPNGLLKLALAEEEAFDAALAAALATPAARPYGPARNTYVW